ncbi:hypothetical protein BD311DRAFT_675659, partial [Dichomitus squalens]
FSVTVLNLMCHIPQFAHLNIGHIKKSDHGWKNDITVHLLCPMQLILTFDCDPAQFRTDVCNAKIEIHCDNFFAVLYNTDMHDSDNFLDGLFCGPLLCKTFEWLFCGHKVARGLLQYGDKTSGRELFLTAYKICQVMPQMIAYAACIVSCHDGTFDMPAFHMNVVMSFIPDEWAEDTLAWWDKYVALYNVISIHTY